MISAIAGASAICCFGLSYMSHQILPIKPISREDTISTSGTVTLLSKEELQNQAKTPRDFVNFYLKKQATLENVVKGLTGKQTIQEAHDDVVYKLKTMSSETEDYGYFSVLKKDLESQYTFLKREDPRVSVSITRSGSQILLGQSQVDPSA
ncbi:hypothetical protein EB118_13320 [bacterium]|nr:hypothetical protein [Actinomycetota bacterium]NDG31032.1 hypothetical protein [bacterium]